MLVAKELNPSVRGLLVAVDFQLNVGGLHLQQASVDHRSQGCACSRASSSLDVIARVYARCTPLQAKASSRLKSFTIVSALVWQVEVVASSDAASLDTMTMHYHSVMLRLRNGSVIDITATPTSATLSGSTGSSSSSSPPIIEAEYREKR